ncbi:TonB-dependent receptor [Novosphingobium nitrogenifigens DSM 19370]|uniref:TonB-dependent receptor n=1 Tax=Novosphingobium nitrogenifigens DSM 19370 TaxID=983920 RepID=F1Z900_9SPHN|nr:TonB-dependent receptor [Novosphingobium nitrogenifigens]EGD58839.1 TonB-dependent receptor [Novosphingobium nitrogenifigens DSM 19370]
MSHPVHAQSATPAGAPETTGVQEIIVTAQRQSQRLQEVPIAVSAFTAEGLERQQIKTASDLQLSLPSVTFTKTNFTSSSFTIRGIGDLCVGVSCDSATAIHLNDAPLFQTRLFEGEFYDLRQVEVLRGPQGTLYGRNATSGVINFRTALPNLNKIEASGDVEYGNYNSVKVKGMFNLPVTQNLGLRVAGFFTRRDGYTTNLYDGSKIDGRNMYGLRGSLRWEPSPTTTVDFMVQYFHENDSRMRIQKQLCQADPTGVLGCLNSRLDNSVSNANATLAGVLTSKELFAIKGLPTSLALGSVYGANLYSNAVNPSDPRQVYTAFTPKYYSNDVILQGTLKQDIGEKLSLRVEGNWERVTVDSMQDYNNALQSRALIQPALNTLAYLASGAAGAGLATYLSPVANALMPNGPTGAICTSLPEESGTGVFGGHSACSDTPLAFDRSRQTNVSWTAEAVLTSKFDGRFNFLLGGIYGRNKLNVNDYYVNTFGLDYFSGIAGTLSALGAGLSPAYLATPYYDNNSNYLMLKTFGIFGEAYYKATNNLKFTVGLRYNDDRKTLSARTTVFSWLTPFGSTNAYSSPYFGSFDADAGRTGNQANQVRDGHYRALTGRGVIDWQITPNNLLYFSYSRGYKSGGINPPLSNVFSVPESFRPEFVNAFEIGSKNTFGHGQLQLNLTGFFYDYKDLQLSRIVARTSVNDNVSAHIYGVEAEAIVRPVRPLTLNVSFSYLHTEVSSDTYLANPRDFGGGRSDAVIIKDLTNASNCAVVPGTSGNAAGANAFVNTVNDMINAGSFAGSGVNGGAGLQHTTAFPSGSGIASTGAYSVCAVLQGVAAASGTSFDANGITVLTDGVKVNVRGNQLPGAPTFKVAAGVQYEFLSGKYTITPRVDFALTGDSTGSVFNGAVNEIPSYIQVNAQVQLDGPDKKWYLRAFVQNLTNNNSITGLYVGDQSSGNYTNIFTLDPRRYGIAAGFKF